MVWAERDVKLNQIYDATPVTNGVVFLAKFAAMASVIVALLLGDDGRHRDAGGARILPFRDSGLYLESLLGFRFIDFC